MPSRLVGIVMMVIGVALLIVGIYFTYQQLDFLGRCSETRAVVVDFHWEEDYVSGPDNGYHTWIGWPVFQFVDLRTGEEVTALGSVGSENPALSVGQEVDILYDPENPTARVTVKSFWDLWLPSIVFPIVGSPLIIVGFIIIRREM